MKAKRSELGDKMLEDEIISRRILIKIINGENNFIENGYKITKVKGEKLLNKITFTILTKEEVESNRSSAYNYII